MTNDAIENSHVRCVDVGSCLASKGEVYCGYWGAMASFTI